MNRMKETIMLVDARDKPNKVKFTSLQLDTLLFKDFNNSDLSIISRLPAVHPENSSKI